MPLPRTATIDAKADHVSAIEGANGEFQLHAIADETLAHLLS